MDFVVRTEEEQAGFFNAMLAATQHAEAGAGTTTVSLDVASVRIDLVFSGSSMEPALLPALRHLVVKGEGPPQVTLHVWDSASCGASIPPPPCPSDHFTDRGDLWGFTSSRYRSAFHWVECSVNTMDLDLGIGIFWVADPRELPYWTRASPLRTLLHWSLGRSGAQLLHAAAVGTEEGAVLIVGKGGAGKTNTALTSLVHGLSYVADDYLAVRLTPEPTVFSLYNTAKLEPGDLDRFASLRVCADPRPSPDGEKTVLHLYPEFDRHIRRSMKLRAVLTPRVVQEDDTHLAPESALPLVRAAAFTTLSQLPYAGQLTQSFIESMVDSLPGFEIRLGSNPSGVARAIQELLSNDDGRLHPPSKGEAGPAWEVSAPLISVIVPVFNGARFLEEAIGSILAQAYPSLEIIVVDDGSTDDLAEVVARLPVDVRFFRQGNAGPGAARNRGIRDASGALLAFLDVDDLWPTGSLNKLSRAIAARPELVVAHGHAQVMTLDSRTGAFRSEGSPAESFPFYIGAGLYRRRAFERIGLFDPAMRDSEDTDWYARLRESGLPTERLPEVTLCVRRHGTNLTAGLSYRDHRATSLISFKKALDRARGRREPASPRLNG